MPRKAETGVSKSYPGIKRSAVPAIDQRRNIAALGPAYSDYLILRPEKSRPL